VQAVSPRGTPIAVICVVSMRTGLFALCLLSVACSGDYEGEIYDQVAKPWEIETYDEVPEGHRIIGQVLESDEGTTSTETIFDIANGCVPERRMLRRLRRAAAYSGGEALIYPECSTSTWENRGPEYDDPETFEEEYAITCRIECVADVSRSWAVDAE